MEFILGQKKSDADYLCIAFIKIKLCLYFYI